MSDRRLIRLLRDIAAAWLMIAAAAGCSDDKTNEGTGSGTLDITVEVDTSVASEAGMPVGEPSWTVPGPDDFNLYISDADGTQAQWAATGPLGVPERLLPGDYTLRAVSGKIGMEGFDAPCYFGQTATRVENGFSTPVAIHASLANALVDITFLDGMQTLPYDCDVILHSRGGMYCRYPRGASGPVFMRPDDIYVYLNLYSEADTLSFRILTIPQASAATYYRVALDAATSSGGVPVVTATTEGGLRGSVSLTPGFTGAGSPVLASSGFTSGTPVTVSEGGDAPEPLLVHVSSPALEHLYFTTLAPTLGSALSVEMDLLHLLPVEADTLAHYGVRWTGLHEGVVDDGVVDLSAIVRYLRYIPSAIPSTFSLLAVDSGGRVSAPLTLSVNVIPVDIALESVSDAVIGVDKAHMTVVSSSPLRRDNFSLESYDVATKRWGALAIDTIYSGAPGRWEVIFSVPEGTEDISGRLLYCGDEKGTFTLRRVAPAYTLDADAFALHAVVDISADDPALTAVVVSSIQFYRAGDAGAGGMERLQMIERRPAEGSVTISGLDPSADYTLYPTLYAHPLTVADGFGNPLRFRTEAAQQLPNSDFEDVRAGAIKYDGMASGGRYSQNTVEIYNLQNRTSFDLMVPERWANVNDKTFCTRATNHNTWYLAPSTYTVTDAYSGAYAVRIDCVGYDTDGLPIPDYLQTAPPFTPYSLNIPAEYSRGAGRLFLGSYSFDAATGMESYNEGIPFASRPVALNGFYKFLATPANPRANALARIELIGEENGAGVVVAEGEAVLPVALSYTAFTIPLTYTSPRRKATSIRILFAPSDDIGDIPSENRSVIVIPDPESSTSRGSSLWIDNISLSY